MLPGPIRIPLLQAPIAPNRRCSIYYGRRNRVEVVVVVVVAEIMIETVVVVVSVRVHGADKCFFRDQGQSGVILLLPLSLSLSLIE